MWTNARDKRGVAAVAGGGVVLLPGRGAWKGLGSSKGVGGGEPKGFYFFFKFKKDKKIPKSYPPPLDFPQ